MKLHNAKRLINRFKIDLREFSVQVAVARFLKDVPIGCWEKRRKRYEKAVLHYLDRKYGNMISEVLPVAMPSEHPEKALSTVWVMWLQGIENMPPIVKACYRQLVKVVPSDIKIQLLTEDNIEDFVQISDTLGRKYREGIISATHMSDIIRTKLLAKYGGCWVDATIWFEQWPDYIFDYPFYTLHAPGLFPEFISRGRWSTFLLTVTDLNLPFFHILESLYERYWDEHNCLIDYLLVDYFFELITIRSILFDSLINQLPENRGFYSLISRLNDEYDSARYIDIMKCSVIQKLTYKGTLKQFSSAGKITNYGHLIGN